MADEKQTKRKEDGLDDSMHIRISADMLATFRDKAPRVTGKTYQILTREFIEAFNEGRLIIKPSEEQREQLGNLYDI